MMRLGSCWRGLIEIAWMDRMGMMEVLRAPFVLRTFPPRAGEIRPHCPWLPAFARMMVV